MTTTTMPRRITTFQYLKASLAVALGFEADHEGADWPDWERELRAMRLADRPAVSRPEVTATAFIPPVRPVRQPIAAIAATPHTEAVCPLDACPLDLGPLEPARLFVALTIAGGAR